ACRVRGARGGVAAAAGGRAGHPLEGGKAGERSHQQAGENGGSESEGEDRPVDLDLLRAGREAGRELHERVAGEDAPHEPEPAPEEGEERALGEELPEEAAASRPQRGTEAELAPAVGEAREREVRDVGAGDEEDERDRAQEDEERGPRVLHQLLAKGDERRRGVEAVGTRGRVLLLEAL